MASGEIEQEPHDRAGVDGSAEAPTSSGVPSGGASADEDDPEVALDHEIDEDPFGLAADIASELEAGSEPADSVAPEDLVSDLIEQAWRGDEQLSDPPGGDRVAPGPGEPTADEAEAAGSEAAGAEEGSDEAVPSPKEGSGERPRRPGDETLFTRPPVDSKPLGRRSRPRPIHIESQLDGDFPAAANQH